MSTIYKLIIQQNNTLLNTFIEEYLTFPGKNGTTRQMILHVTKGSNKSLVLIDKSPSTSRYHIFQTISQRLLFLFFFNFTHIFSSYPYSLNNMEYTGHMLKISTR